jgi:hypothetical protein
MGNSSHRYAALSQAEEIIDMMTPSTKDEEKKESKEEEKFVTFTKLESTGTRIITPSQRQDKLVRQFTTTFNVRHKLSRFPVLSKMFDEIRSRVIREGEKIPAEEYDVIIKQGIADAEQMRALLEKQEKELAYYEKEILFLHSHGFIEEFLPPDTSSLKLPQVKSIYEKAKEAQWKFIQGKSSQSA